MGAFERGIGSALDGLEVVSFAGAAGKLAAVDAGRAAMRLVGGAVPKIPKPIGRPGTPVLGMGGGLIRRVRQSISQSTGIKMSSRVFGA